MTETENTQTNSEFYIMSKPLGYWGCNYDLQLITDVMETFGDNLQNLEEFDQAWLIGKLGDFYWTDYCDSAPSDEAEELASRLYELSKNQLGCLKRAVINKSMTKPLTYWGCDHELQLIQDVADAWNWNLQDLSEIDYYWLIARLGSHYWMRYCDSAPSDAAQELIERIDEIPQHQVSALIQALANK